MLKSLIHEAHAILEGADKLRDPTAEEIQALRAFVKTVVKTNVTKHKSKDGVTVTVHKPQTGGTGAEYVKIVDYLLKNGWVGWPSGDTKNLETMRNNATEYDAFYTLGLLVKAA